ncbi:MAG TPA: hypothetical protein VK518_12010, partial [Puia sp.]|nr:hypothetical protein [Puia sp.]
IEEVVLVQQAAALVGTFGTQQQLGLIKTRRGKDKQGVMVGAHTGLVNASGNGKSDTRIYHQYYAGAYLNLSTISFGISGDYQRDVFPFPNDKTNTPFGLQRWRLNGYFTWRPNARNEVEATMNYAPQSADLNLIVPNEYDSSKFPFDAHVKQHLLLPRLVWHSDVLPGLRNDLQVSWIGSRYTGKNHLSELTGQVPPAYQNDQVASKGNSLRVNERLVFQLSAGGWKIEPALNASYEHIDQKYDYSTFYFNGSAYGSSSEEQKLKRDVYILTPAMDISYKRLLDINGGVFLDVSGQRFTGARKSSAFASVAVDLLQFGRGENQNSLKLFGSYAQQTMLTNNIYTLGDLSAPAGDGAIGAQLLGSVGYLSSPPTLAYPNLVIPSYWVWESGVSWSPFHRRLQFQYTFERRRPTQIDGGYAGYYEQWRSTLHHFGVRAKILDGAGLSWESGLNLSLLRGKTDSADFLTNYGNPGIGAFNGAPDSWTGGWVNRLRLGDFTAGLDLLYHFRETVYSGYNVGSNFVFTPSRVNSFVVPNIYAGYDLHLPHGKGLELFAESRGLVRNHSQDLMDVRKYYTIGGKLTIQ